MDTHARRHRRRHEHEQRQDKTYNKVQIGKSGHRRTQMQTDATDMNTDADTGTDDHRRRPTEADKNTDSGKHT